MNGGRKARALFSLRRAGGIMRHGNDEGWFANVAGGDTEPHTQGKGQRKQVSRKRRD